MAVLNAATQTALAVVQVYHPGPMAFLESLVLGLLAGIGVLWGAIDTWYRRIDRGIVWLKAAILAGLLAGLLGVIGRAAFVDQTGLSALGPALSGGAAFIALLVLIPVGLGLLLGNLLGPRPLTSRIPPVETPAGTDRSGARSQPRKEDRSTPRG